MRTKNATSIQRSEGIESDDVAGCSTYDFDLSPYCITSHYADVRPSGTISQRPTQIAEGLSSRSRSPLESRTQTLFLCYPPEVPFRLIDPVAPHVAVQLCKRSYGTHRIGKTSHLLALLLCRSLTLPP